ncbi:MAG: dihydropteroate synthase [Alphaproteobacteria bacterium]|nr:dihydropteroate synthase [Alphaproteobacteria bacterium]
MAVRIWWAGSTGLTSDIVPVPELATWSRARGDAVTASVAGWLDRLSAPRPPFAGLALDRPLLMGVVNVTPDSFSDGGDHATADLAIAHGHQLRAEGADILDVGGESTRPGAEPVAVDEELGRVLAVVSAFAAAGIPVSIDTRRSAVMAAAIAEGARIVNDVTALAGDPESLGVVAASGASVVLMHMRGEPATMQRAPAYAHAPSDIYRYLHGRLQTCRAAGIAAGRIAVDPGIGFGKTLDHNLALLDGAAMLHGLGVAVAMGVSRKGFIGRLADIPEPKGRLGGSLAAGFAALNQGVQILRVHDMAATRQARQIWLALGSV